MLRSAIAACALLFAAAAPAAAQEEAPFGPALYVVRDADSTMYIFGTLHIRKPNQPWGGANALAALAEAEEIWLEAQESENDQALFMQHAFTDRSLPTILTESDYLRYSGALRSLGIEPAAFDNTRPWFAALMIQLLPLVQQGYDPEWGADSQIEAFASANNVPIKTFETTEDQIRFLAERSERVQIEFLIESVKSLEEGLTDVFALERAWETGDLDAILSGDVAEMQQLYPELYEVLLERRNMAWMTVLERELGGSGTDFVAVGAAHLVGEHGLVAQFAARGYTIERVPAH